MTLLLLPSPLLGPSVWLPVREELERHGLQASVADLPAVIDDPETVLASFVQQARHAQAHVVIPHSNAGLYAPSTAAAAEASAMVFVDAALPAEGRTPLAPQRFIEFLTTLADAAGMLPPWTQWWTESDLDGLFPTEKAREQLEAAEPRLPLSYFTSTLDVPTGWPQRPCAYVAFGETYAGEIARARDYQWPCVVMPGSHLHLLHDPGGVAATIERLIATLA